MESIEAVNALSGLANDTRLKIFRHLVQTGPDGESAGDLANRFGLPGPTLSFHLAQLCHCGLVFAERNGRRIMYSAGYTAMNELMMFLTDNCCAGDAGLCASLQAAGGPPAKEPRSRRTPRG